MKGAQGWNSGRANTQAGWQSLLSWLGLLLIALSLNGCGVIRGKKLAAAGVDTFHERFNAGRYEDIYLASGPGLQNSTSKLEFLHFIQGIRRQFGACTGSSQATWGTSAGTNGTVVTLVYNSYFERGRAKETFIFQVTDNLADLQGYNIDRSAAVPAAQAWTEAEAQREAVRRYPELGKPGSRMNADFLARYQRYQREDPAALKDPAWPLHLAEESAQAVK